jgi:hypothetical protein
MAGIVARYLTGRARADVSFHGWKTWTNLVGSILVSIEEADERHGIHSPITCVELLGGRSTPSRTIVRAGYAL